MIHVIATVETQPGKRSDMLAEFRKVQPLVHAEEGCLEYGAAVDTPTPIPVQDALRPDTVVIVEKWESLAHLQAHLQASHMADYRVRIRDFVKGVRLQVLEPA